MEWTSPDLSSDRFGRWKGIAKGIVRLIIERRRLALRPVRTVFELGHFQEKR
jgi:hypothetical protein